MAVSEGKELDARGCGPYSVSNYHGGHEANASKSAVCPWELRRRLRSNGGGQQQQAAAGSAAIKSHLMQHEKPLKQQLKCRHDF